MEQLRCCREFELQRCPESSGNIDWVVFTKASMPNMSAGQSISIIRDPERNRFCT